MSLMGRFRRWFGLSPSPTDDFWYRPANGPTAAGVAVDELVAMTYSACWACTRVLSTAGAMSPLELLRYLTTGGSEPAEDLRRYHLVYDQFNPHMSNFMFRSTGLAQQINWGNFFGEIEFTRADQVLAIHPIHASRVPARNIKRESDGSVYYLVNNGDGTQTRLEAWEMLHVPSPASDDGIFGKGVVTQARLSIGFGIATETQGAAYMGNSARPTVVVKGGKFKDQKEREYYRQTWMETHGGPSNNGKPALLPPEADISTLQFSAEDSQFLQTRQHNIEEVARWYGVPPHMIGHLLRSTYNNIEHQSIEFVRWTLRPWLVAWEQELNRKLLMPEERRTLYFHHDLDDLERGDLPTRTQAMKEKFFNGEITLDEWRASDDLPPLPKGLGKIHFVQQAMVPLEIAAKGPQPPATAKPEEPEDEPEETEEPDEPRDDMAAKALEALTEARAADAARMQALAAATTEVIEVVVAAMLDRERKQALEASRKPSGFAKWVDLFYEDHSARLSTALAKPVKAYLLARGKTDGTDEVLKNAVERHVGAGREALLQSVVRAAALPPDQFPKVVESCLATWNRRQIVEYLDWVTINGTPVFIGKDGSIEKGPKGLVGKKPSEIKGSKKPGRERKGKPEVAKSKSRQEAPAERKPSARAARAKAAYNPSTKAKQDASEQLEHEVTKALGGTKSGDNLPMDVTAKGGKIGMEVKMLHDAKDHRINMRKDSRQRKEAWRAEKKGREVFIVAVDNRDKFEGGKHKANYSGHKYYYYKGIGAVSLNKMTKANSLSEIKEALGL